MGKSTLLNSLLQEKVAIVTNKPQTTRNLIRGIYTRPHAQIIFIDTPGIHKGQKQLSMQMMKMVDSAMDSDVLLLLVAPHMPRDEEAEIVARLKHKQAILLINKIDTIDKGELLPIIEAYSALGFKEVIPISATKGDNLQNLVDSIVDKLPQGPKYFPGDNLTDADDGFIIAEMVREKALYLLNDEIPHGIAVVVERLLERDNKPIIDIDATIFCEKQSHKGIIIGKQGAMLKEIGSKARADIQRLYESKINLQLWVKVKENWRDSEFFARRLVDNT